MGGECNFAHSELELRSTPNLYKTALCNSFMAGECKLGEYCRFAHGETELRAPVIKSSDQTTPMLAMNYFSQQGGHGGISNGGGYNRRGGYQQDQGYNRPYQQRNREQRGGYDKYGGGDRRPMNGNFQSRGGGGDGYQDRRRQEGGHSQNVQGYHLQGQGIPAGVVYQTQQAPGENFKLI